MFYMHLLINKRGPLAKIWLAAHWEKKLTKAHIFECNLETTVEKIISPKFTIALRTSGHLLLGVVRIYHRKAKYLLADCSEALTKMKTAFRPGLVDLPAENFEAAYQSITLPEEFHDFETPLPDLKAIDVAEHFTLNQSKAEDITLTDDYESNILLCDRTFDEEPDALRKQSFDGSTLTSSNSLRADCNSASVSGDKPALHEDTYCFEHDWFGDEGDAADMIEILLRDEQNDLDKDIIDMEEECPLPQDLPENSTAFESSCADTTIKKVNHLMNETVLFLKENEEFVLEPIDDTAVTQRKKNKRKRKLLVDVDKELSCSTIYKQLNNCTDILTTLDLAPPTKKTMMWKKSGGVENLLSHAAQPVVHAELQKLFERCFKSHRFEMKRNGIQRESEVEETRKEQDTTEMLIVEEPSYPQESAHSEIEIRNDSFMLTTQNNRNETHDNCGETIQDGRAGSESSALLNNSLDQEAETQRAELTKEQTRKDKDSEEIRWSKRTLQLLKTLQHLQRSGARSFSLQELCQKNSRKEAAVKFYIFLVLKKQSVLELSQGAPFADITATLGPMFHTQCNHTVFR
ncbi:double-strand-break repair protein rad21-like protein 1 [Columba livia]|uniref:double-strand-break repair protein rad21-like protein 1 n=1 Tax=Columba livia TaxID=8932 RepID=UPI0031BAD51A